MGPDDVIWKEAARTYTKYKPFLEYDKPKMKKILVNHFKPLDKEFFQV